MDVEDEYDCVMTVDFFHYGAEIRQLWTSSENAERIARYLARLYSDRIYFFAKVST